ncbi:MAG: type II toxin-antitoxin system RelE/ParE family toxin [Nitrospinae bacterium]|nr:type II toxin-antitoxin system RelE/ParE family toxin [Nitrospinota bacterium]MCH8311416.1 type II toxin-antitoxin system RelE/ParE family toxin [Nitrospinota bacterium]
MASFKIEWKKSAEGDLLKLDRQVIKRIIESIDFLSGDPFPKKNKKLRGSTSSYRMRIGDYRIIYQVDTDKKVVTIFYIRHRKDAYRKGRTL